MLITIWLVELVVLGLLLANRSTQKALRLQQRAAVLQAENDTARYTALQSQLNPHFLFNSLNTLIAEIEYNPQNAVHFTKHLSSVYRYVLQSQDKTLVTLGEELEFIRSYLSCTRSVWATALRAKTTFLRNMRKRCCRPSRCNY